MRSVYRDGKRCAPYIVMLRGMPVHSDGKRYASCIVMGGGSMCPNILCLRERCCSYYSAIGCMCKRLILQCSASHASSEAGHVRQGV